MRRPKLNIKRLKPAAGKGAAGKGAAGKGAAGKGAAGKPAPRKGGARKLARLLGIVVLLAAGVYAVNRFVLGGGDDEPSGSASVRVRVLAPGTFTAGHPYAPYYVVPDKKLSGPSKLSRAATSKFVTAPDSALQKDAMAASPQIVRIELRGQGDRPVTVESVRVKVVSDARPLKGWFIAAPGCGVERTVRVASVSLDVKRKRTRKLGIAVGPTERKSVEIQASTRRGRVAWVAELTVSAAGRKRATVTVDDSGQPFRVTSPTGSRGFEPLYGATGVSGFGRVPGWDNGVETGC